MRVRTFVTAAALSMIMSTNAHAFDFSPLGQFRAGFYGLTSFSALRGLGSFVQGLQTSYLQSGRQFGFYPQAFNNSAYARAMNFNSSGVFRTFNNPF